MTETVHRVMSTVRQRPVEVNNLLKKELSFRRRKIVGGYTRSKGLSCLDKEDNLLFHHPAHTITTVDYILTVFEGLKVGEKAG